MLDHNAKQTLKLGIAYIALVLGIVLFVLVCSTPASAQPLVDKSKYEYVALCELNDISYVIYGDDVTIGGYQEGFIVHAPVMVNSITLEETKIGKKIYLSRTRCFLLEK